MTRLRFGPGGIPTAVNGTIFDAVTWCGEHDLRCMELEFVHSVWLKEDAATELKAHAKRHDVHLTAHGSYYINLNAVEPEKRAASRQRVIDAARRTWQAGGKSVTFHPAFLLKQDPAHVYATVKKELRTITAALQEEGIPIRISPETTGKPTQFGTYEELCRLAAELDQVGVCIDFAHIHARSNGGYNTYEEFSHVLETVENSLGKPGLRDMHIHMSGIAYGPKGEKHHLVIAESDINWQDLLRAWKDFGIGGWVVSESPVIEQDALFLKQHYTS